MQQGTASPLRRRWYVRLSLLALVFALALVVAPLQSAFAYAYLGSRLANQPTSGCCASVNLQYTSMTSKDTTGWNNARSTWNGSAANVLFYNGSSSYVVRDTYNSSVGWDGVTYNYGGSTTTSSDIYLNSYYTSGYSDGKVQAVSAHELGHLLGLAHVNGCVLMNPYTSTRYDTCGVNYPTSDEVNGVNGLY